MVFYTAGSEPRPIRLPQAQRQRAWESLQGRYGDGAMATPAVEMDDIPGFAQMSPLQQYDAAVMRIAQQAPLRLCPGEQLVGAATLGDAIGHVVPARFAGKPVFHSVSHLTIGYDTVLHRGLQGYEEEIAAREQDASLSPRQRDFLRSLRNVLAAMRVWHGRYRKATRTAAPQLYELLGQVPFGPARTFHEALQSLWFVFAFVRLCGNWPGIGRIDWLLGPYLKADLAAGRITLPAARELLADLFIKGCEWIRSDAPAGSGDAQHYQNLVLAGIDEAGRDVACEVTDLVLDVVEELPIGDFPITVRVSPSTSPALLRHMAQVIRHGGGVVAVYNEPLILQAMQRAGYPLAQARRFANDGCWEVQVPGATNFMYMPFDGLQLLDEALGLTEGSAVLPPDTDMEGVYAAFTARLRAAVDELHRATVRQAYLSTGDGGCHQQGAAPASVVSLFEEGCIAAARDYYDLGPRYTVRSPHLGGAPDVGNALYAIQQLVFVQRRVTLPQLIEALRANWEGYEPLRLYARNRLTYYGNDSEADTWVARVLDDFADIVQATAAGHPECPPVLFVPGVSTFGRQIEWLPGRHATAFGAKKGEILAGNASPTPGTDAAGATAVIRSYCKADLVRQTTGAALDVKLFPDTVAGENGLEALTALLAGFVRLGGYFMQLDVVDAAVLRAAQQDPAAYKTLSVRVSGWNARFVTLDSCWQEMIIERTAQHV